ALCRCAASGGLPRGARRFWRRPYIAAASPVLARPNRQNRRFAYPTSDEQTAPPRSASPSALPCRELRSDHGSRIRRERGGGRIAAYRGRRPPPGSLYREAYDRALPKIHLIGAAGNV